MEFDEILDRIEAHDARKYGVLVEIANDGKCYVYIKVRYINDEPGYRWLRIGKQKDDPRASELADFGTAVVRQFGIPTYYRHAAAEDFPYPED